MTTRALLVLALYCTVMGCNQPAPGAPNEIVFLYRNNPGVAAGARVVAVQATNGADIVDLGSTGGLLVKLDDHGRIAEGYIVGRAGDGESPGIVSFNPRDKFSQQVLLADPVAGGAVVDAPGIGTVLIVKDVGQCDIRAYHAGTEIWKRSVEEACQTKYEQIGQIGNLVVTIQASTDPTGLVDPATGNLSSFAYPAESCTPIGEVGLKPVFGCNGPNKGNVYVQVEGGTPIVDDLFDGAYPTVLKAPQHDDAVLVGAWKSVFYHIDASGHVISKGTPPQLRSDAHFSGRPILSPDASSIYYPTTQGVIAQSVSTGSTHSITSSSTQAAATSRDGKFLYALTSRTLDVIYLPTVKRVASYPQDARDILLVTTE